MAIALLITVIVLSIKFALAINSRMADIVENGIPSLKARFVQLASLLYILPAIAQLFPVSWLAWFLPLPFGLLALVPGIALGRKHARLLERSGKDVGVAAGRNMANVMWLGIGIALYMLSTVVISEIVQSYKEF